MVMSYFQRMSTNSINASFYTTGTQKKIDRFNEEGFYGHCNTMFESMCCLYQYRPCREAKPALSDENIQKGTKKREMNEMQKQYIEEKSYAVVKMWEFE